MMLMMMMLLMLLRLLCLCCKMWHEGPRERMWVSEWVKLWLWRARTSDSSACYCCQKSSTLNWEVGTPGFVGTFATLPKQNPRLSLPPSLPAAARISCTFEVEWGFCVTCVAHTVASPTHRGLSLTLFSFPSRLKWKPSWPRVLPSFDPDSCAQRLHSSFIHGKSSMELWPIT